MLIKLDNNINISFNSLRLKFIAIRRHKSSLEFVLPLEFNSGLIKYRTTIDRNLFETDLSSDMFNYLNTVIPESDNSVISVLFNTKEGLSGINRISLADGSTGNNRSYSGTTLVAVLHPIGEAKFISELISVIMSIVR